MNILCCFLHTNTEFTILYKMFMICYIPFYLYAYSFESVIFRV